MSGTRGADALPRERCVGSGAPVVQLSVFSDANEDHGWVYCRAEDTEQMHRMMAHIVHYVRDVELQVVDPAVSDEEERARVLSDPLEVCPERADNPEYYEQILCPTSLSAITHRLVHCEYAQPALFEQDVLQLFSNARQWYGIGSEGYADMATLQRLYHELTPSRERLTDASGTRHIKARASDIDVVTAQRAQAHAEHRFASSAYGPGQEPPSDSLVSQPQLVEVAYFKGRAYHVGDWVHIMNPVDASRPIVGQLARLYKKARTPGTFFTACWYYRPEQTHHAESRLFGEREVLQTGVYGEHALEDILEDVLVLYIDTYRRARPAVPYWTPEIPVYYVESKYDVHRHEFHRIRDWAACVPSAVRDKTTYVALLTPDPWTYSRSRRRRRRATSPCWPRACRWPAVLLCLRRRSTKRASGSTSLTAHPRLCRTLRRYVATPSRCRVLRRGCPARRRSACAHTLPSTRSPRILLRGCGRRRTQSSSASSSRARRPPTRICVRLR